MNHSSDGYRIWSHMCRLEKSSTKLVNDVRQKLPYRVDGHEMVSFKQSQVTSLLNESHTHHYAVYKALSEVFEVDDPLSLTRRNSCVHRLKNPEEENARIELGRLLHQELISTDTECLLTYLLNNIASRSLPHSLQKFEVCPQGWERVLEASCPAGLVEIRGGKYLPVAQTPFDAIRRTHSRQWQLFGCLRQLFNSELTTDAARRFVGEQVLEHAERMRRSSSFNEYVDADIDWQLCLSGGDMDSYEHMLIATRSYRLAVDKLNYRRQHDQSLVYQPGFSMRYDAWSDRMRQENYGWTQRLAKVLADPNGTEEQARSEIEAMIKLTVAQLQALVNALEERRGTKVEYRKFQDIAWPEAPVMEKTPGRARRARTSRTGRAIAVRARR